MYGVVRRSLKLNITTASVLAVAAWTSLAVAEPPVASRLPVSAAHAPSAAAVAGRRTRTSVPGRADRACSVVPPRRLPVTETVAPAKAWGSPASNATRVRSWPWRTVYSKRSGPPPGVSTAMASKTPVTVSSLAPPGATAATGATMTAARKAAAAIGRDGRGTGGTGAWNSGLGHAVGLNPESPEGPMPGHIAPSIRPGAAMVLPWWGAVALGRFARGRGAGGASSTLVAGGRPPPTCLSGGSGQAEPRAPFDAEGQAGRKRLSSGSADAQAERNRDRPPRRSDPVEDHAADRDPPAPPVGPRARARAEPAGRQPPAADPLRARP